MDGVIREIKERVDIAGVKMCIDVKQKSNSFMLPSDTVVVVENDDLQTLIN